MLSMNLPLLPPPPSSLLPSITPDPFNVAPNSSAQSRRPGQHTHQHGNRPNSSSHHHSGSGGGGNSKPSLAALALDERTIAQRKMAIAMYGYSWLKPAGCVKTMLGRREEELEREESERQLAEVEREERARGEMEEMERVERLAVQARAELEGGVVQGEEGERDLDGDVPDMDGPGSEEEEDEEDEDEEEEPEGDEHAEVDPNWRYDSRRQPDTESEEEEAGEGETGITDDVEASHLHSDGRASGNVRRQPAARAGWAESRPWDMGHDAEALANAMLDEDELGEMERDLDDEIPDAGIGEERDLDDEVPEAEDEEEWQHTDTELDLDSSAMMDESAMDVDVDVDVSGVQTRSQTRRRSSGLVAGNVMAVHTPMTGQSGGGRMSWLGSASARRNLFGRGVVGGGLFGRGRNITPPQGQVLQTPAGRERRSGRRRGGESLD